MMVFFVAGYIVATNFDGLEFLHAFERFGQFW